MMKLLQIGSSLSMFLAVGIFLLWRSGPWWQQTLGVVLVFATGVIGHIHGYSKGLDKGVPTSGPRSGEKRGGSLKEVRR